MRDLTEMNKLEEYLKEKGIGYERADRCGVDCNGEEILDWHQIRVFEDGWPDWDVVCHHGSYGYEEGLLEGMGSIFGSDVEGHLTADDVIRKIEGKEVRNE